LTDEIAETVRRSHITVSWICEEHVVERYEDEEVQTVDRHNKVRQGPSNWRSLLVALPGESVRIDLPPNGVPKTSDQHEIN
jgi:hypothetical protein